MKKVKGGRGEISEVTNTRDQVNTCGLREGGKGRDGGKWTKLSYLA